MTLHRRRLPAQKENATKLLSLFLTAAAALCFLPAYADAPMPQQIQVKIEWVSANPKSVEALTVTTTNDTTGGVSLMPGGPTETSVTVTPHINTDGTITVKLTASRKRGKATDRISTARTFKSGDTLTLGGLVRKSTVAKIPLPSEMLIFATATLVQPPVPQIALVPPVRIHKLPLAFAEPSAILASLRWQSARSVLPEGVTLILPLTGDHSLLVKATDDGFARVKTIVHPLDVPSTR